MAFGALQRLQGLSEAAMTADNCVSLSVRQSTAEQWVKILEVN